MSRNVRPWALLFACLFIFSLPGFATTINPTSATIQEHSTKQFTASTPSKWTTTCGTISSSGLLTAPLYPATSCHITAVAISGSGSATALVNIVSPIVMTPASAKTPQGKTQQFTASMPVTWIAKCGTITAGGLFTASAPVGSSCTIEAISTGTVKYTVYGYDTIALPAITISPLSPTITEGANQQFTASVASTFTASCGAITAAGLFKAPLTQSSCTVTAKASDGTGRTVATTATIKSPIVITPSSATTGHGLTQQFTANSAVKWSASCGAITTSGLFTASAAQGSACKITATAASGTAYTASVVDTIGAAPSLTISPSSPTLTEGSTQQFTASAPATWTATCGTIGAGTGAYTAPLSPGSCTITATATDGSGHVASTTAKISSPIVITPSSAATGQGQTQQFTASSAVTWSATCGTISSTGLYTASAAQGSACKITATAATGTAYTASVVDTIGAAPSLTISPSSPTLTEGSTQQFTASVPATWTATCGTIGAGTGAYTAPLSPGSCTITATATDGSGHVTSTTATIPSPLVISPITATTGQGQTQQFTANASVTWNASCGVIDANGMFTASASQGSTCTITATAASGTAYTATAQDVIGAPPAFTLSPLSPNLSENATQQFTTSQPATFAATCGSIDQNSGLYTAPLAADSCTVTATDASDTTKTASTTITVTSPMVVTPAAVTTPAEITQQFIANLPATWQSSCGTVDITGLFTAPNTPGSVCTITATATSGPAYTGTAADTAGPAPDLIIGPGAIVLNEGDTKQFTSNVPSTFSATCGTIDPNSGLYATPLITGDCTVTATATDGTGKTASAVVSVTSPLVITPASATTAQNLTQQFTANMPATWSASCGTVDATGLFTAPSVPGSICQITAIASGATAYSTTANDTIIQYPILTISPLNPSMNQADTLPFTTSIAATFTASCGTIDPSQGSYTAPLTSGTCMVTATSTDGNSQVASTSVTVTSPFVITPSTATTSQGLSQQFTANQPATWASTCGSIDSTGLYSASSAPGIACTITATAASGTAYTATAIDTVGPPVVLAIQPAAILLNENATQQFTSNVPAAFTASCGTINAGTGLYTAPLKTGSCTITAKPAFGTGSATATATVTSPLTLSPISTTTASGATQQFTANMAAAWTSSCGSITAAGLFTASGTQGSVCTITATATGGPAYTATAADTVGAPVAFTMSPTQVSLAENANQQFTATVAATWNTTCGTIGTGTGLFTAPLTPGSCTITAQATDGSGQIALTSAFISSPLVITPTVATTALGQTQQFTASSAVTWTTSCGSISSAGLFTASAAQGAVCTITATATGGTAYTSIASDTIGTPVSIAITSDFASPPPSNSAISTNMLGVNAGGGMHSNVLNYMSQASLNYTRFHANIEYTYRNGPTPDWSMLDANLTYARNANLQVILEMDYTPPSLQPVPNPCPANVNPMYAYPTDVNAMATLAAAYVQHIDQQFPGLVTDYEIWNEPDGGGLCASPNTYAGKLTQYLNIFAAMAPAIRQAATADGVTVRIGGPALASPAWTADTWLPALLNNPQTAPYFDFVSFHYYVAGTSQVNQGMTWSGGTGIPSLLALTQAGTSSLPPLYTKVATLVRQGLQSGPLSTPIYVDEYNSDWTFLLDCCRNSPIYSPLWNTIFFVDLLNTAAINNVQIPSKLLYYAANNPPFCIAAPWDAAMDCKNAGASTATPYPQYYSLQLLEAPQYLGLVSGGSMVPSTSSNGNLLTAAFTSGTSDEVVIVNTSATDYPAVSVSIARNCSAATGATEFLLNSSNQQIATQSVQLDCSSGGYATSVFVPAYSVVALNVAQ